MRITNGPAFVAATRFFGGIAGARSLRWRHVSVGVAAYATTTVDGAQIERRECPVELAMPAMVLLLKAAGGQKAFAARQPTRVCCCTAGGIVVFRCANNVIHVCVCVRSIHIHVVVVVVAVAEVDRGMMGFVEAAYRLLFEYACRVLFHCLIRR